MREVLDCIPCYLKQVMNTLSQVEIPEDKAKIAMREALPIIKELNPESTPAENATYILNKVYKQLDNNDPFKKAKHESNELALSMLPRLRELIRESEDPLYRSLQIAVAGNIIDMGIIQDIDVDKSLEEAMSSSFAKDDYELFKKKLAETENILIIGDNSGEIAFDRLLAEKLKESGKKVTYVVKGGPILNDATLEDAAEVNMEEVARVITTGSGFLGVVFDKTSNEFLKELENSSLVISKGQANYETLESAPEAQAKTFFLLRAKCEVVAQSLGVKFGEMVFCLSK